TRFSRDWSSDVCSSDLGFLLLSAVYALSLVVQPWLAALIVGGVVSLVGIVLLLKAKKSLDPKAMVPERTIESLRRDQEMVKRSGSEGRRVGDGGSQGRK